MARGRHAHPRRFPHAPRRIVAICLALMMGSVGSLGIKMGRIQAESSTRPIPTTTITLSPNPFADHAIVNFLSSRRNDVTAAVCDLRTGAIYTYNPDVAMPTASMVKIDILAALLHRAEITGQPLSDSDISLATLMVEHSDNDAATTLFNELGGPSALNSFNQLIGMSHTTSFYNWGATLTTPYDEIALLRTLVVPSAVLTDADRQFEMGLMEHVVDYQRFGVGTGETAGALVGLKNGWFPFDRGWGVNSAGFVMLGNTEYLVAIQTAANPSEQYGRESVSTLSRLIWTAERRISATTPTR